MGGLRRAIKAWHGGRTAVVAGGVAAAVLFAQQLLATDATFYSAVMKALSAGLVVLAVVSIGKQLWKGADVQQLGMPGGPQLGLSPESAKATEETAEALNKRMTTQMDDVNKRLYDLETSVFKDDA